MQGLPAKTVEQREVLLQKRSAAFCARAASLAFQATDYNVEGSQQGGSVEPHDVDAQPTVLLLTQNIGAIRCCSEAPPAEEHFTGNEESSEDVKGVTDASSTAIAGEASGGATVPLGSEKTEAYPSNEEETLPAPIQGGGEGVAVLTERSKQLVYEFIADLRSWIHRAASFADARRRRMRSRLRSPSQHGDSPAAGDVDEADVRNQDEVDWWTTATDPPSTAGIQPPQIDVIVIHFQEVGGADRERAFSDFFATAISTRLLPEAGWTSGLLMHHSDPDAEEEKGLFTGVGSIVFLSPRMCPITSLLLIPHRIYIPVLDDPCSYGGSILRVFHGASFTSSPRSRKGFVFISLRLGTVVLNLCNVHLFHDADNTKAVASSPSRYARRRLQACLEAIAECLPMSGRDEPFFVFGDFNTRLDGYQLTQQLQHASPRMELRTGPRELRCPDGFWARFAHPDARAQLRALDREPSRLLDAVAESTGVELAEMPVSFAPTYLRLPTTLVDRAANVDAPHGSAEKSGGRGEGEVKEEDPAAAAAALIAPRARANFAHQRIPAWCDRIMFNPAALEFVTSRLRGGGSKPPQQNRTSEGESDACDSPSCGDSRPRSADVAYLYDAVSLLHTDHDGVFLLF